MDDEIETCKNHTIRAGHRWKVGDKFSPRVWSGKPYRSPQVILAPDVEIKKIFDIRIKGWHVFINNKLYSGLWNASRAILLAKNDGLEIEDFWSWFSQKGEPDFEGQIICWNEKITY